MNVLLTSLLNASLFLSRSLPRDTTFPGVARCVCHQPSLLNTLHLQVLSLSPFGGLPARRSELTLCALSHLSDLFDVLSFLHGSDFSHRAHDNASCAAPRNVPQCLLRNQVVIWTASHGCWVHKLRFPCRNLHIHQTLHQTRSTTHSQLVYTSFGDNLSAIFPTL